MLEGQPSTRTFFEYLPAFAWRTDAVGNFLHLDPRFLEWQGARIEDHKVNADGSFNYVDAVHPDDAAAALGGWAESLDTGTPYRSQHRMRGADNTYRWCQCDGMPVRDASGAITDWYGTIIDVDEFKRTETSLRDREHELVRLADTVPVLIWSTTATGEPIFINRRLCEWAGIELTDLDDPDRSKLAAAVARSVHPEHAASVGNALRHSFETGAAFAMRYRHRCADGGYRWVEGKAEPLRDDAGRIVRWYGVSRDIEDEIGDREALRKASLRLARATQAASLSALSASIAHEVNQPLAAVVTNAQACQRWLAADPPNLDRARQTIARIVRDAFAGAQVLDRIRALFHDTDPQRLPTQINHVVTEAHALLGDEMRAHGIEVSLSLDSGLPPLPLDRVQVQQLLVNLMRNGAEAMAESAIRRLELGTSRIDGHARLEVRDFGTGLDDPDAAFEPFVTSKPRGMGMGLAICRSIARAHGGELEAQIAAPVGTRMIFSLPLPG
ncbi:PAS domain-containing sensor histidine kinase [Sphingomonas gei]|uniref:histidine kinase n=1 Tax=Sphingomonas gei TaxID=1395960 RepID=A0A4S1XHT7_9SPHN|nr:PAS domain-containing protein [Sphingomonas gei]TGX55731.1 PAS domain-containing sensor histidine kinase [Sphingomonas gei]